MAAVSNVQKTQSAQELQKAQAAQQQPKAQAQKPAATRPEAPAPAHLGKHVNVQA